MTSSPQPPAKIPFNKPWLPFADQVEILISRGLLVPDKPAAEAFLSHVNYYRFSGYCLAFEEEHHKFLANVSFADIRAAYEFDLALRDLLTEALEIVEVDLRTCLSHHFGKIHGAFGHTDAARFYARFDHAKWMESLHEEAERSSELFVEHFRATYAEYPDLPVWILTEVMSFGVLTRMYRGMERSDQKAISARYGIQSGDFATIMLHLVYIRNLCAHHSRIWDRVWAMKASLPHGKHWQPPFVHGNDRLFSTLLLLYRLLSRCPGIGDFATTWRERVHARLAAPPNAPDALDKMGLPEAWAENPLWQ